RDTLGTGLRRDRHGGAFAVVVEQQQRGQGPHTVPRYLRAAAVRIEQLHRRAGGGAAVDDQAVGADAGVPLAYLARERGERHALDVAPVDVEKVVAVGVRLGESNHVVVSAFRRTSELDSRADVDRRGWLNRRDVAETRAGDDPFVDFVAHVRKIVRVHKDVETPRSETEALLQPDVERTRVHEPRIARFVRANDFGALIRLPRIGEARHEGDSGERLTVLIARDRA